ncbi:hypothetical protein PTKIN_Ptkin02bG0112900 [Pterospermum kingtungense]
MVVQPFVIDCNKLVELISIGQKPRMLMETTSPLPFKKTSSIRWKYESQFRVEGIEEDKREEKILQSEKEPEAVKESEGEKQQAIDKGKMNFNEKRLKPASEKNAKEFLKFLKYS